MPGKPLGGRSETKAQKMVLVGFGASFSEAHQETTPTLARYVYRAHTEQWGNNAQTIGEYSDYVVSWCMYALSVQFSIQQFSPREPQRVSCAEDTVCPPFTSV